MKTFRYLLVLVILILGFSFISVNAQNFSRNGSTNIIEQKIFKKILNLPYYGVFDNISFQS